MQVRTAAPLCLLMLVLLSLRVPAVGAAPTTPPLVEQYLTAGELAKGEKELQAHLRANPRDDEARFGLGVLQFARGVERLGQSLHKYGLRDVRHQIPFLRLPVGGNPDPEEVSYQKLRNVFLETLADLEKAEATLAAVQDNDVKLRLHFGSIRLDLNGDGSADPQETLWRIYDHITPGQQLDENIANGFIISFDRGDVYWLQGYCHVLSGMCEMILAHNWQELFDRTGYLLFEEIDSQHKHLVMAPSTWRVAPQVDIVDVIAFFHLINLPCDEPQRMKQALAHFERVTQLSRLSWTAIEAETDDDQEWVPNSRQTGILPGIRVSVPMVKAWRAALDETDEILAGRRLVPHWRVRDGRAINFRKVFTEPRNFDAMMWIHGSAATPYLERGPMTNAQTWTNINSAFGGRFIGFAFWFN